MWVRSVTVQGWGLGNSSESWIMQETPRFLMNKKSLTLLAENHRGGSVLVPTVPVGMPSSTLRVFGEALGRGSVHDGVFTQSVGTR